MLLQIEKKLKQNGVPRTDIVEGVKRANTLADGFTMVEFYNGDVHSFSKGEIDSSFTVDSSQEFKDYKIESLWLLSDTGKTLSRLL